MDQSHTHTSKQSAQERTTTYTKPSRGSANYESRGGYRGGYQHHNNRGGYSNNYDDNNYREYRNDKQYNQHQQDANGGGYKGKQYYQEEYKEDGSGYRGGNYRGRGGYRGGRGRGGNYHNNDRDDQNHDEQKQIQSQMQQQKQNLKQTSKGLFSADFDKAFGLKPAEPEQTQPQKTQSEEMKVQEKNVESQQNQPVQQNEQQKIQTQIIKEQQNDKHLPETTSEILQEKEKGQQSSVVQNQNKQQVVKNGNTNHKQEKQNEVKENSISDKTQKVLNQKQSNKQKQEHDQNSKHAKQSDKQVQEKSNDQQQKNGPQETQQPPIQEEVKKPVKVDFVPDPNFSWDLDLENKLKPQSKKKKKDGEIENPSLPRVIQSTGPKNSVLRENIKMKIAQNLEFSTIQIDKLNKGLTNSTNCCYMNVILQSLLSIPAFFNMLVAISKEQELMKELGEDSLLRKFVYLSLYFDPTQQLDRKSPFAANPVDAEKIFIELNHAFNPYQEHQDCCEFLFLLLDQLHDELKKIYVPQDQNRNQVADEWQEIGSKNAKCKFNNDQQQIDQSIVRDIFGGIFRNEFQIGGSNNISITYEPFFVVNLEITRCETVQDCLTEFFKSKIIDDYKLEGKTVRATHQQQIDKLPNIMILQLKRFVYRDGPVKLSNFIEFPEVLRIEDNCLSTHLKLNTFSKEERDQNGRSYRLASTVIHKGTQLSRGHYVCYVLDANNQWILYDDNKIRKMIDIDQVFESQAYLLFYELM